MEKTMKAVVKYDNVANATELRDMPVPEIGPTDVLVRVAYIGICGTDPHMHQNLVSFEMNVPLIFGHEFAGTIEKVGSEVKGYKPGDRVTAETHADYCGECELCRTNQYPVCRDRKGYGFKAHGAFAKYVKVPARILHRVPDNVSLKEAALTEPLCVAYKALVHSSRVNPGDTVVVIGPGPIGMLCIKMAQICGASEIIAVGASGDEERLKMALDYGATMALNSQKDDVESIIMSMGDGYGVDLVVDAAGVSQTLKLSMDIIRPGGQITKIGWGPKPVGFSLDPLISKGVTLRGHFSHTWDVWEKCLVLLSKGQVDLKPLITHELTIDKWEEGFRLVESREAMKVVLKPID
ncbi:MAG: alcohol dehydrogenase catalytic domain-containing protein [Clostridiaceae bacterium]|jgi:alcohol dehydrogenase/L-iditol 2-dehydrogenase|nr:alcohol dehydrogenase catalytic domain-containing protein [Clostridiaceae bacterium]